MRTYTLLLSIVAHLAAVLLLIVVPLVATDILPDPRQVLIFGELTPPPEPPLPRPPVRSLVSAAPRMATLPVAAPEGIHAEPPAPSVDAPPDALNSVVGDAIETAALPVAEPPPPAPVAPIRVGGAIRQPRKISDAVPAYPPIARAARVEGIVILEAVIAENGAVRDVRILRSIPLLDAAAIEAVRQWRFTPTLLNGQPVAVIMTVTVAFNLR